MASVRGRTLALIAHLTPADLERPLDPIMSPLVWDLAHIAADEDLWLCHRLGGLELLHGELAAMYDAFETPRPLRARLPVLDTDGAIGYLADVRARTTHVLEERGAGHGTYLELVLRHELQHSEGRLCEPPGTLRRDSVHPATRSWGPAPHPRKLWTAGPSAT